MHGLRFHNTMLIVKITNATGAPTLKRRLFYCLLLLFPLICASYAYARPFPGNQQLSSAEPNTVGIDPDALDDAVSIIRDAIESNEIPGAVILVARRGKIVLHQAFGYSDVARTRPLETDTLFRMASNSKALTATGILVLAEEGLINLDDHIGKHLPAFATDNWNGVTIRHLLTHTSGSRIDKLFLRPLLPVTDNEDQSQLISEVNRFADISIKESPGETYSYNNAGYNILAAIIEKTSGSYKKHLQRTIYVPLGMTDSCNHESDADRGRMSTVFVRQEDGSWAAGWQPHDEPDWPFPRGSGGMVSTAFDYAKFCQMLINGGTFNGNRILSRATVREMTTPQSALVPAAKNYGLGFKVSTKGGVFSHTGSDGTYVFIDPARELIGMVLTQTNRTTRPRDSFRALVQSACNSLASNDDAVQDTDTRYDGFYKDIFMDSGKNLTSRKTLYAAESLALSYEYYAGSDQAKQNELLVNSSYDSNGVLLFPDGQPRFKMLYVNGGGATRHGESLATDGLARLRQFYFSGGSYCGSCAGSFFSGRNVDQRDEPRESYLHIFPYNTFNTGMKNVRVGHVLPENSPLLTYRQFGTSLRVEDIYHNNGNWLPQDKITSSMPNVEVLAVYDHPGHKVDGGAAIWAYKRDEQAGRIVNIGCHPEGSDSGDKLLLTESSFLYAMEGIGAAQIKSHLEFDRPRVMDKFTTDHDPAFTRIGGLQYHHFTFDVPSNQNSPVAIELSSTESLNLHIYLSRDKTAIRDNADYMATGRGANKSISRRLTPGKWYLSVFCAESVRTIEDSVAGFYRTVGNRELLEGIAYSIEVKQVQDK